MCQQRSLKGLGHFFGPTDFIQVFQALLIAGPGLYQPIGNKNRKGQHDGEGEEIDQVFYFHANLFLLLALG
ncbi:hypothetical protein D3C80_1927890 [compost metagenome]